MSPFRSIIWTAVVLMVAFLFTGLIATFSTSWPISWIVGGAGAVVAFISLALLVASIRGTMLYDHLFPYEDALPWHFLSNFAFVIGALLLLGRDSWKIAAVVLSAICLCAAVFAAYIAAGQYNDQREHENEETIHPVIGTYLFLPWGTAALLAATFLGETLIGFAAELAWIVLEALVVMWIKPRPRRRRRFMGTRASGYY